MLDPVDGSSPYAKHPPVVIKPGQQVNFVAPALHIAAGLDSDHKAFLVACAPKNLSNNHFFNAWQGPIWQVNCTAMGHMDLDEKPGIAGAVCPGNKNSTERGLYRKTIAAAIVAFMDGLYDGKLDNLANVLQLGRGLLVPNTRMHNYHGTNKSAWKPMCA